MPFPSHPGPFITSTSSPWGECLHLGLARSFRAGATLLYPGDCCSYLYYVRKGAILTTHFFSPEDAFKVNIIAENAVAGLVEMFAGRPPRTSWRALRSTECVLFSREQVEKELPNRLLIALLEQAAFMSTTMVGRFATGLSRRNDVRLARFLLHLAEACPLARPDEPGGLTVVPSITQEVSSDLLGMHPATFNKLLAAFRAKGIIGKTKRSRVEILDPAALAAYAEGNMPPLP